MRWWLLKMLAMTAFNQWETKSYYHRCERSMKDKLEYLIACGIIGVVAVVVVTASVVLRPIGWLLEWERDKARR